ncbi:MAG: hypothetical protein L0Y66_09990 [Myxococcaceae bacterium]|nr:hypothetical protein [Myxococcaceae bacterium]
MQSTHSARAGAVWAAAVGAVNRVSLWLGGLRWVFMPLGLFALVAVGVHAAADRVDDSLRFVVQGADALMDTVWGRFAWTRSWVDAVGERECTRAARALVLLWELVVAGVMGLPLLGYAEEEAPGPLLVALRRRWGGLVKDVTRRPTLLRVSRPVGALCFVLAGVVALGQTLQASLFHAGSGLLGADAALLVARLLALAAMLGVAASLGGRAFLRHLQHADAVSERDEGRPTVARLLHGLPATVVMVPLAVAALVATAPVMGFFR